ncbi:FMN-binding negative transcriptional regulator [Streptomyces sp. KL116D]|uniref:FMN-binding negative transcriptional regulator n=1 Tax=Streptomyces sp. KL116D TaxID=3045152 RepID=UPI003558332E
MPGAGRDQRQPGDRSPTPPTCRSSSTPKTTGDPTGELPGTTLLGHLNRANPHWAALETGSVLLLTFTGPHSYVSPTVYEKSPAAPTWNFTSVHVRGVVEKDRLDGGDAGRGAVHRARLRGGVRQRLGHDRVARLLPARSCPPSGPSGSG